MMAKETEDLRVFNIQQRLIDGIDFAINDLEKEMQIDADRFTVERVTKVRERAYRVAELATQWLYAARID